jgi:hypothetical protein
MHYPVAAHLKPSAGKYRKHKTGNSPTDNLAIKQPEIIVTLCSLGLYYSLTSRIQIK